MIRLPWEKARVYWLSNRVAVSICTLLKCFNSSLQIRIPLGTIYFSEICKVKHFFFWIYFTICNSSSWKNTRGSVFHYRLNFSIKDEINIVLKWHYFQHLIRLWSQTILYEKEKQGKRKLQKQPTTFRMQVILKDKWCGIFYGFML